MRSWELNQFSVTMIVRWQCGMCFRKKSEFAPDLRKNCMVHLTVWLLVFSHVASFLLLFLQCATWFKMSAHLLTLSVYSTFACVILRYPHLESFYCSSHFNEECKHFPADKEVYHHGSQVPEFLNLYSNWENRLYLKHINVFFFWQALSQNTAI